MDPRLVIVEFWGGPFDGFHNGWTTDELLDYPPVLIANGGSWRGQYDLSDRGDHRHIYLWREWPS